jgi:hypothetical protein
MKDQLMKELEMKLKNLIDQIDAVNDFTQKVDEIFDTEDLVKKDNATCDTYELIQKVDEIFDIEDLVQNNNATCDTYDPIQKVDETCDTKYLM